MGVLRRAPAAVAGHYDSNVAKAPNRVASGATACAPPRAADNSRCAVPAAWALCSTRTPSDGDHREIDELVSGHSADAGPAS